MGTHVPRGVIEATNILEHKKIRDTYGVTIYTTLGSRATKFCATKMEISINKILISIIFLVLATWAWSALNWVWFRPRRLERYLRKQGFQGKPYRLLFGDMKKSVHMLKQALSKPIDFCDDYRRRVDPFLMETVKCYGSNCFTWNGPTPRVNITNPEHIRDIFTKINEFQRPRLNPLAKLLATGLANYDGDKWAKHRKIINPAFHIEKIKLMVPVFYESCSEMIEKWENLMLTKGSSEIDVWPHLQSLTCDIIARTAFGSNYKEGTRIFDLLREQAYFTIQVIRSVYIPGWRFLPTKTNRKMKAIDREIKASLKAIINKRDKAMEVGEAANDDLLGILMESNIREMKEHGNNKNVGLSSTDVIEECKLFYFAGQETTSVLLVWTMILLCKYQNWQERGREEVLQIFGGNHPDIERLNRLKVVTMILNEVLRLYSPVPQLFRRVDHPIHLGDSLKLPASIVVSIPSFLVHYDAENWGDDVYEFKPERFAEGVSKATKNQVSFFPFGWGARICIGQNFALTEAKLALVMILQRFSFELSPSYRHAPFNIFTLQPQYGAQIILRKI